MDTLETKYLSKELQEKLCALLEQYDDEPEESLDDCEVLSNGEVYLGLTLVCADLFA